MGVKCPRKCPKRLDEEECEEFGYERSEAGVLLSHCSLSAFLAPWRLFGCLAVGWSAVLAPCRFFPHSDDDIFVPAGLDVLPAFQHL